MMIVSVMHVVGLIVSRKLREHWLELLPKFSDATDGMKGMAYNLGIIDEKPVMPHHSYVEKVEYWAMVWGTCVMVATRRPDVGQQLVDAVPAEVGSRPRHGGPLV